MCELFAMSSTVPATVNYSLERFARHGGLTRANRDGWGIAYFEHGDIRLIKEPNPASDSPWVRFIAERNLQSRCVIAHVRWATHGGATLENTHPFERELGGRRHVFAHNGSLSDIGRTLPFESDRFRPIGGTDSEHAFCVLLQRLAPLWDGAAAPPSQEARLETVARFAAEAKALGAANFLYSDGEVLFAHAHRRRYEENGRITEPRPPGLHMLCQRCAGTDPEVACDGLTVSVPEREVVLLASVPLTDGPWVALPEGAVVALQDGREVARVTPRDPGSRN